VLGLCIGVSLATLVAATCVARASETNPSAESAEAAGPPAAADTSRPSASIASSTTQPDLSVLLGQYLSTASGRKLAGEITAILKSGESDRAEALLLDAIDMGTLASLLVDQLENPALRKQLESNSEQQPVASNPAPTAPPTGEVPSGNPEPRQNFQFAAEAEQLQADLRRERDQSEETARELATARDTLEAREGTIAQLQEALRQEQIKRDEALAKVTTSQQSASDNGDKDAQLAQLRSALQDEQQRSKAAEDSASAAREQLAGLSDKNRHQESRITELETSVEQERGRGDDLARDYVAAQEELSSLAPLKAENADLRRDLQTVRDGHAAGAEQLAAARQRIAELESNAASLVKLQRSLQQERDRSAAAVQGLANARTEIGALKARLTQMADEFLERERKRSDLNRGGAVSMGFELFSSRNRISPVMTKVDFAKEAFTTLNLDADAQEASRSVESHANSFPLAVLPSLIESEKVTPTNTVALGQEPAAANDASAGTGGTGSLPRLPGPATNPATASAQVPPMKVDADRLGAVFTASKESGLVRRADTLLRSGDVSGARLLLERASNEGSALAAFRLGETYDPAVLSEIGALGMRGDAALARDLYTKALNGGIDQAARRLQALK